MAQQTILDILGKDATLSDVLLWHSSNSRDKYSHFGVFKGEGYFSLYDSEITYTITWDLTKSKLSEQSEKIIEFLNNLI